MPNFVDFLERRPIVGTVTSVTTSSLGWFLAHLSVITGVLGFFSAIFGIAVGYLTFRIQLRRWLEIRKFKQTK
jgi:hypothetical protein